METYQRAEVFVSNECIFDWRQAIADKNSIRNMWADHFEFLGKPSSNANFDSNFLARVANTVQELFVSFIDDPSGTLSESLKYEEVEDVCSKLKMGISGVDVDYEQIPFCRPTSKETFFQAVPEFFHQLLSP